MTIKLCIIYLLPARVLSGATAKHWVKPLEHHQMSNEGEVVRVCICDGAFDLKRFMIECEFCDTWFHGDCVNITEEQALKITCYACPRCTDAGKHSISM